MKMLESLPLDLLRHVTGYLEGLHIGLLWFCGDSRLQHRLGSDRGVVHFHLVYDPLYPFVWPSLIRNFELESFVVTLRFKGTAFPIWKPSFSNLKGSKLTTLSLCCPGDPDVLYSHLYSNPDAYPRLERISSPHPFGAPHLRLFGAHLFSLRELLAPVRLNTLVPTALPRNLTQMTIEFDLVVSMLGVFFPDSLEKLSLIGPTPAVVSPLFPGLPVGLQSLDICYVQDYIIGPTADSIGQLPRCLKELTMPSLHLSVDHLAALPPILTKFELHPPLNSDFWAQDDHAAMKALPRTITQSNAGHFPLTSEAIQHLPSTITGILPELEMPYHLLISHLPRLQSVYIDQVTTQLPDSVTEVAALNLDYLDHHALPSGLRILKLRMYNPLHRCERLERLPKFLYELDVQAFGTQTFIQQMENLPHQLKSLRLEIHSDFVLTPTDCESFPRSLTSLVLESVEFQSSVTDAFSRLPPHLEKLHIAAVRFEVGCLKMLPCSKLRNLRLAYEEDETGLVTRDIVMSLPRKLAFVELEPDGIDIDNVKDKTLMNLPPGLCSLIIECVDHEDFVGTCKNHLPKSLTHLQLGGYDPTWFPQQ